MPEFPRVPLILKPTPLHRLDRLSDRLGIDLWIKRDDLTGFALGGNKGRKIEYLIADALARKATTIVTSGAIQSNFVRQLGVACAMHGLKCAAAVMSLPYFAAAGKPSGATLADHGANVWVDRLAGVDLRVFPDGDWDELAAHAKDVADEYERAGNTVMLVPTGGSSPLSAFAFYEAAREAQSQAGDFDCIVTPSSSGSTHAGLATYHLGSRTRVVGVCADDDPEGELLRDVAGLCRSLLALIGDDRDVNPNEIEMRMEWFGEGYAVLSQKGMEAIRTLALSEGIFLDPIYSGKAFAGLLDMAASGEISGRVLFWHTGGTPTLFAVPDGFSSAR